MSKHDCRQDPICLQHCVGCTRNLNFEANLRLRSQAQAAPAPSFGTAAAAMHLRGAYAHVETDFRFMIIKPLGLAHLRPIMRHLRSRGAEPHARIEIGDWQALAEQLYQGWKDAPPSLVLRQAFMNLEQGNRAMALCFDARLSWDHLRRLRQELRLLFPAQYAELNLDGKVKRLRAEVAHAPDRGRAEREWAFIKALK